MASISRSQEGRSANKRIAVNSVFMGIRMVIVLCITLYTTRIILKQLGIEDYGIYNVVCGFVSTFAFLNTSMSNGIQRFYNYELSKNGIEGARRVYNMSLIVQLLILIIMVFSVESFGLWYINNKLNITESRTLAANYIFQSSVISFVLLIMQVPYSASIIAHEKMDYYAIVSVLDAIMKLCVAISISHITGDNLIIYALLMSGVCFVDFLMYYTYAKYMFPEIRLEWRFHKSLFFQMIGFSGWNFLGTFANTMKEQGINIILNLFYGPIINAARGIAVQVNAGMQSFVNNITTPVRPQVVQSYAIGNINRTMRLTYSVSKISCLFLYFIALPIISELDYILEIWLGENIPNHTSSFVCIIVIMSFFNNLNAATSGVVHASGKMRTYQLTGAFVLLTAIPLAFLSLQMGGSPEMVLWLTCLTVALNQVVALYILKHIVQYSLKEYITNVILPICYVILFTVWIPFALKQIILPPTISFFLVVGSCMASVTLATYVIALNDTERRLIDIFFGIIFKKIFI